MGVTYVKATAKRRFIADLIDLFIIAALMFGAAYLWKGNHLLGYLTHHDFTRPFKLMEHLIIFGIPVGYKMGSWAMFNRSIGKIICELKIIDSNSHRAPTSIQYLVRFIFSLGGGIMYWVSMLISSEEKEAVHDVLSRTFVITPSKQ